MQYRKVNQENQSPALRMRVVLAPRASEGPGVIVRFVPVRLAPLPQWERLGDCAACGCAADPQPQNHGCTRLMESTPMRHRSARGCRDECLSLQRRAGHDCNTRSAFRCEGPVNFSCLAAGLPPGPPERIQTFAVSLGASTYRPRLSDPVRNLPFWIPCLQPHFPKFTVRHQGPELPCVFRVTPSAGPSRGGFFHETPAPFWGRHGQVAQWQSGPFVKGRLQVRFLP